MAKDWTARISSVNFRCTKCRAAFEGEPDLVEDDAEQAHHPFRYFAHCPECGAEHQPQAAWERALLKAHQFSTGPKTPEGMAATAANLAGHPTPNEALRTRFNAMKHGAAARTATYFPAKPGGYSFCARCDVDRAWCAQQPACVKQTEIFMLHHAAFDRRDPKVLTALHADMHAALMATLQMCIQEVLGLGVLIKAPKVELDREGSTADAGAERMVHNYAALAAAWQLLCEFTGLPEHHGGFMGDLTAEMNAHIGESVSDRQPWAWIVDKLLSEIAQRNFRYPFEFDTIDEVPVLCVRSAHVMAHMSTTATLREFWDGLPVKSDRVFKKQLAAASVLMTGKDGLPLAVERTVGHTRVSNMVALSLTALRGYGLHAAVPAKGTDGYGPGESNEGWQ